ncbi:Phosphoglycerate kinase [Durusdinium trenchii]|uniref:Phosphoglycerate kinase n=1 Tax=Durusdinium trenchii TaxID=1381693 RepID=A0ABP0IX77_9DINO
MLDRNALLFIGLQFGSRFANSFLVTAARYELLEAGGIFQFAGAQVATNVARMLVSQVAGLLTDNFALKRMYVASEALNLVLAVAMLACGQHHSRMLFALNIGLGLLFAFSQPVTKSMPPAVAAAREDLAIINGWDLTCDKIGRYLAPFAYAVVSSSHGFNFAVLLSCLMYALMSVLRMMVTVLEPASRRETKNGASQPTVAQKLGGLLQQVVDGVTSLRRDKVLQLLIINTLVTNVFLYPLNSVHFPVLFKQVAEREKSELDRTVVDDLLHQVMLALDIKRKDMWRNYNALVSLGGVAGPFLSNAMIYMLESYSTNHKVCQLWVGVNFGIVGQISTMALLAGMVLLSSSFGSGSLVFNLASALKHLVSPQLDGFLVASKVGAWIVTISVNNIVTTYFNSISQERLQQKERGRFIANIMTIFNLGSICGSLLFGWVLSAHENSVTGSVNLLLCGLMIKIILLVLLRREGKGTFSGGSRPHSD